MTTLSVVRPWSPGAVALPSTWPPSRRVPPLVWLAGLRVLVAVTLLAPLAAFAAGQGHVAQAAWLALLPIIPLASSALCLVQGPAPGRLLSAQFGLDAIVVIAVVWTTGGLTGPYAPVLLLPVLAASVVRGRRAGIRIAAVLGIGVLGLTAVQNEWLWAPAWLAGPLQHDLPQTRSLVAYTLSANVGGMVALALLVGQLSESLTRTGADLARTTSSLADLIALSQRVIDSMAGGLIVVDAEGHVVLFNRTAEIITQRDADEVLGLPLAAVLPLPPMRPSEAALPARVEFTFARADLSVIELGATVAPLVGEHGRAGQLVTFQDLTLINQREAERQRQERLAAVGEMAAGIAHEIRNPLASMTGSIQLLQRELALRDDHALLLDIVMRESQRLNNTIKSFLTYAGPNRLTRARVNVATMLRETASLLQQQAPVGAGQCRAYVDAADVVEHDVDEAQLRQVIWNLASNGIKAMPSGGTLCLSVSHRRDERGDRTLRLAVRDEGTGLAPGDVERMFQPFQSGFRHGSGLGLAIVRRIVTDHGGSIAVHSAPGCGTELVVTLPGACAPGGAERVLGTTASPDVAGAA